jgi:hypothetical protein
MAVYYMFLIGRERRGSLFRSSGHWKGHPITKPLLLVISGLQVILQKKASHALGDVRQPAIDIPSDLN